MKEIMKFAIKAVIVIGLIVIAAVLLNSWGVFDFSKKPSKAESNKIEREYTNKEIETRHLREAQETIATIMAACKIQFAETGQWATDISQLRRLQLERITKDHWNFRIIPGENGIKFIQATSTKRMAGGAGKVVLFDAENGLWNKDSFD